MSSWAEIIRSPIPWNWARGMLLLLGFVLISLPLWLLAHSWTLSENRALGQTHREAIRKNEAFISRCRQTGIIPSLVEERIRDFTEAVTKRASRPDGNPGTEQLWQAILESISILDAAGITPLVVGGVHQEYRSGQVSAYRNIVLTPFPGFGFTPETAPFFRQLGEYFGAYSLWSYADIKPQFPHLDEDIKRFLKISMGVWGFTKYQGRGVPVQFGGRPCLLFSHFLKDYRLLEKIQREIPAETRYQEDLSQFHPLIPSKYGLGTVFLIVPQDETSQKGVALTTLFDDRETSFACVPDDGRGPFLSPHFPFALNQELLSSNFPLVKDQYLVSCGKVFLDQVVDLYVATKIPPPRVTDHQTRSLMKGVAFLLAGIAFFLWPAAVCFEIGITAKLIRQLWWGFLLAVILPVTGIYFVTERFAEEQLELLNQETRTKLRAAMNEQQLRLIANRPSEWQDIIARTVDPTFVGSLRQAAEAYHRRGPEEFFASSSAFLEAKDHVMQFFKVFHRQPINVSLDSILVAGLSGFTLTVNYVGSPIGSIAGQGLAQITEDSIYSLVPGQRSSGENQETKWSADTRRELIGDTAKRLMVTFLGPDRYFDLVNGIGHPIIFQLGAAWTNLLTCYLPDEKKPEFVFMGLYPMRNSDRNRLSKSMRRVSPGIQIFAVERERSGKRFEPEDGDSIPFLRKAARQTHAANTPQSFTFEHEGETYLVEGVPNYPFHQFLFLGMVPQKPLLDRIDRFKRIQQGVLLISLLITLLLAFSGSREIILPLLVLSGGMKEVQQGNFQFRLPEFRNDELGDLVKAFNRMNKGLAEGKLLTRMVSQQACKAITQEMISAGEDSVRCAVVILFLGCLGTEEAMKKKSPEEFIALLDRQTRTLCRIVVEQGGDIDKLMGEKILAVFFPTNPGEISHLADKALAAVQAITAVQALTADQTQSELPFRVAAGINFGEVITGFLGASDRRDHTVIGDTVNLSARSAALAETLPEHQTVITEAARGNASPSWHTRPLEVSKVKGKKEEVSLHQVLFS